VALESDYIDYLVFATRNWTELGNFPTDQDLLLNVVREAGEAIDEYFAYAGTNVRKGPPTGHMVPVVQELADTIAAALTAIIRLGFDPNELLEQQKLKVQSRYPSIWPDVLSQGDSS
jgi:hypothetical protein